MHQEINSRGNVELLRGAALWLLTALVLAWCLVGLKFELPLTHSLFPGKFSRLLQAHLDFLLMSALLFGFFAARVPLSWSVRWAMVVGAFTNSSLFLLQAMFPVLDTPTPPDGIVGAVFRCYMLASIVITSYGFGSGAAMVLRYSFAAGTEVYDE